MLDEVVATEEMLKEKLFEEQQAEVVFLMEDEVEVGLLYFFNFFRQSRLILGRFLR